MGKDIHNQKFDEGTLCKLEIFEKYAQEWLPVFVMSGERELWIFDFFAGPGISNDDKGSPIRILCQINKQAENILRKGTTINLLFNEYNKIKNNQLISSVENFILEHSDLAKMKKLNLLHCNITQLDFNVAFAKYKEIIIKYPSLAFFDQNGIKFINDDVLNTLIKCNKTDFLFFFSSSYYLRFGGTPAFQKILQINIDEAKAHPENIHKIVLEEFRKKIPQGNHTKLYPFTIKKANGIYGIIFGASHILAVDKFLSTAWRINKENGEANFDINDESNKIQLDLFEPLKLSKIEQFKQNLRTLILKGVITNNIQAYLYTLENGHIPRHAADEIKEMEKNKLISYEAKSPMITYKNYKTQNIINYRITGGKKTMRSTKIEWTDKTWNPITGCTKKSMGCAHCYAEVMSRRLKAMGLEKYSNSFNLTLHPENLDEPKQWIKSHNIFVCSMSDLFHEDVSFDFIDKIMDVIKSTPQHRYQILTKRAERMAEYFLTHSIPENVWLGTTVECKSSLYRIDCLRNIPASVRFLSCEPLLEDLGEMNLTDIDWVIVGGESGPKARPMQPSWVTNIMKQVEEADSAFFFKQWGTWGSDGIKRNKHKNGKLLNGRIIQQMPKRNLAS